MGLNFATCAAGHFGHLIHLVDPATQAAGVQIYDWQLIWIDGITAALVDDELLSTAARQSGGLLLDAPA